MSGMGMTVRMLNYAKTDAAARSPAVSRTTVAVCSAVGVARRLSVRIQVGACERVRPTQLPRCAGVSSGGRWNHV